MAWLADDQSQAGLGVSLARMTVMPGQTSPAHRHPNCNEVIHVLSGEVEERCNDTWHTLTPGDTLIIKAGETHQSRNSGSEPAKLIIAYSDGSRTYEDVT